MIPPPARRRRAARAACRSASAALLLVVAASFGPCARHDPTAPGTVVPAATMSDYWPNADGLAWDYGRSYLVLRSGGATMFPSADLVPRVSVAMVLPLLATDADTVSGSTLANRFRMQFTGDIATRSGVLAQNLAESDAGTPAMPARGSSELLARLAAARPDLRARIARLGVATPAGADDGPPNPLLIHGYAWCKTPAWIGTFGDVDTQIAWKFLESKVAVGDSFTCQLVPSLADNVFLFARVTRQVPAPAPWCAGSGALEVVYVIDYGASEVTAGADDVLGWMRWFDYGRVLYVPGVGPVYDEERRMAPVGDAPANHGRYLLTLALTDTRSRSGRMARSAARAH